MKQNKTCSIDGCENSAIARGLCRKHYSRLYTTGTTDTPKRAPRGAGHINRFGYRTHRIEGRHRREHVLVAEKAIGKRLPKGAIVHHVNEDKLDNRPANLVVCPNDAYHSLIHQRTRALEACGHAGWMKCRYCGEYDDTANLYVSGSQVRHRACFAKYMRERRAAFTSTFAGA